MSTSTSSATDLPSRRILRRLGWASLALYTAQTTAALFALIVLVMTDLPAVVQIYGDAAPIPGGEAVARVAVYARGGGTASWESVTAEVLDGSGAPVPTSVDTTGDRRDAVMVRYEVPRAAERLTMRVVVDTAGMDPRTVEAVIRPQIGESWLGKPSLWGAPRPRSSRGALVPGITANRGTDACTRRVELVSGVGMSPARMPHRAWLRVTEADGTAVAGMPIELVSLDGTGTSRAVDRVTDALGLAEFEVRIEQDGGWAARFDCGATPGERTFRWVPTQDGFVVHVENDVLPADRAFDFVVTGLRGHGVWFWDVVCDGRRVASGTQPGTVHPVTITTSLPDALQLPAICTAQAYLYLVSDNPPVAVQPALVGSSNPVEDLTRALVASRGERRAAGITAMARTAAENPVLAGRYVSWALAQLSPGFVPIPLLVDDSERAWDEFVADRRARLIRVGALTLFDVVVLVAMIAWLIQTGRRRQRRALEEFEREGEGGEELGTLSSDGRATYYFAAGFALMVGVCAGFVVLLRAMSL
jgi:hypothetical protein